MKTEPRKDRRVDLVPLWAPEDVQALKRRVRRMNPVTDDPPFLAQLCYWGEDSRIEPYDHSTIQVVARANGGYIVLLGAEELEVYLPSEDADLIRDDND